LVSRSDYFKLTGGTPVPLQTAQRFVIALPA